MVLVAVVALLGNVTATRAQSASDTLTFSPSHDATIRASQPTLNFGTTPTLLVDGSPQQDFLLRFDLSGIAGRTVLGASLHLHNVNSSGAGGTFFLTSPAIWDAASVTWATAPATTGGAIATLGAVSAGSAYEVDLASVVQGDGNLSLRVTSASNNGADYVSSDHPDPAFRPSLVVNVQASNTPAPPVAVDDAAATFGGVPVTIAVLNNDVDPNGTGTPNDDLDLASVAITAAPANGSALPNPTTGTIAYAPAAGFLGVDQFRYRVADRAGALSGEATVTVAVTQNQPPVAADDAAAVNAGGSIAIPVLANDADPDGPLPLTGVTIVAQGTGTAALDPATGAVIYTPAPNFLGDDAFTYLVTDTGGLSSNVATVSVRVVELPNEIVVAAVGDIACKAGQSVTSTTCRHAQTANLASAMSPAAVLALGDVQYNSGGLSDFQASYDQTWGIFNPIVYPVPGNHEYGSANAGGYFTYFGARAGNPAIGGYYSFDLGNWHIIALNTNCDPGRVPGGCGAGSPQAQWLAADLAQSSSSCTLAFGHHPRWASGSANGDNPELDVLWRLMADAGVDLFLAGHNHNYPRYTPLTANGQPDPDGIREIIVGTGGRDISGLTQNGLDAEVEGFANTFGVLRLSLQPSGYAWDFITEPGDPQTDSGAAACGGGNAAPIANDDDAQVLVDSTAQLIPVLDNDTDSDGSGVPNSDLDPASVTVVDPPSHGQAVVDLATGRIAYTPDASYAGLDSFTYRLADFAGNLSNLAAVTLTIAPNSPPTAVNDAAAMSPGETVVIDVLDNDLDANGTGIPNSDLDPGSVAVISPPEHGQAIVDPTTGAVRYTLTPGAGGDDTFAYEVADFAGALSNVATVIVTVSPAPIVQILAPSDDTFVRENTPTVNYGARSTLEVNGSAKKDILMRFDLRPFAGIPITEAILTLHNVNSSPGGGDFFLTAPTDWDEATVTWDTAPAAAGTVVASLGAVSAGGTYQVDLTSVVQAGGVLTVRVTSALTNGADYASKEASDASLRPTLAVSLSDGSNIAPTAVDDAALTLSAIAVSIDVLDNDLDPNGSGTPNSDLDPASVTVLTPPANGGAVANAITGEIAYTPALGFIGNDSFSYQVADRAGTLSNVATVTVAVTSNTPPTAVADAATTPADTPVTIPALNNDTDPDGTGTPNSDLNPASLSIVDSPSNGQAVANPATGTITYTPAAGFVGDDTFSYQIADAAGAPSNVAIVAITVQSEAPPSVLIFGPTDDATIRQSRPGTNYGAAPDLLVDASSKKDFLIRFDLAGLDGPSVSGAVIRLFVLDASPAGGGFHAIDDWNENSVTWESAPPILGAPIATLGAVSAGQWYEVDVTNLVAAGGIVSLRVVSPNSNGADYASKEHADATLRPQLIVSLN